MGENKIEKHFRLQIEAIGGQAIKFPPLFYAGFPDRIVLLPGGLVIFVELKAPYKHAGKLQEKVHARLRRLGFRVEVLDSYDAIDGFLLSL